jgi:hypothetical protein
MQDVIDAALESETDFVIITDHIEAYAAKDGWQGWHRGENGRKVLCIVGSELRSKEKHDFLCIGTHAKVATGNVSTRDSINLVKSLGSFSVVAHPQGMRHLLFNKMKHPWREWDASFDGIEVWDYMHDWIEDMTPTALPNMCKTPDSFITGPDPEVIKQWDRIAERRKVSGIGGLDVHEKKFPRLLRKFFPWADKGILPYLVNFKSFSHYCMVEKNWGNNKSNDVQAVIESLKEAHGWICWDALRSGRDFSFYAETKAGQRYPVGSALFLRDVENLRIIMPSEAYAKILSRGVLVAEGKGRELTFRPEKSGEYRCEVFIENKPWIYTNHIYIR